MPLVYIRACRLQRKIIMNERRNLAYSPWMREPPSSWQCLDDSEQSADMEVQAADSCWVHRAFCDKSTQCGR